MWGTLRIPVSRELLETIEYTKKISTRISNEEATKQHLILPLLQVLGWDINNPDEVYPEATSSNGQRPDYVLKVNYRPVAFLEAKNAKSKIFRGNKVILRHARQLLGYCFEEGVALGILTNGIQWALLKTFEPWKKIEDRVLVAVDLRVQDIEEAAERLVWFSRRSIRTYYSSGIQIPKEYSEISRTPRKYQPRGLL
ncbi:hypothetical protein E3E23_02015 [Thermococcus sp. CX2]|uniref:type I restriction endonuclease n=1 Tax=Thermococcus sp. CX2 TaxID=163006 RepID=UPI00143A1451|nr:type I restriction endonuclease [Thermococcus sp. CX2]NJE84620.1 hypothetical protein [Thermococcus sp. CX2]